MFHISIIVKKSFMSFKTVNFIKCWRIRFNYSIIPNIKAIRANLIYKFLIFLDKINHTHSCIIFIVVKSPILEIETITGFIPRTVPSKEQKQIQTLWSFSLSIFFCKKHFIWNYFIKFMNNEYLQQCFVATNVKK